VEPPEVDVEPVLVDETTTLPPPPPLPPKKPPKKPPPKPPTGPPPITTGTPPRRPRLAPVAAAGACRVLAPWHIGGLARRLGRGGGNDLALAMHDMGRGAADDPARLGRLGLDRLDVVDFAGGRCLRRHARRRRPEPRHLLRRPPVSPMPSEPT
jgi:hypothetical protein